MKIHVVKKGETLFSIARQYGVSARLLQKQNEAPEDGALVPGQTLVVLLPDKIHTVQPGDTVYSSQGSTAYPSGSCIKTISSCRGRGH